MKKVIFGIVILALVFGIFLFVESRMHDKIPILMYHSVDEEYKVSKIRIRPERFENDLIYMKENGYTAISFDDLIKYKEKKKLLPKKPVIITFDDGYLNNYEYAYPLLKKHKMKATMFLIANRVGVKGYYGEARYTYLDWEEAREMEASGLVDINPHSFDLHNSDKTKEHGKGVGRAEGEGKKDYYKRLKEDVEKIDKIFLKELDKKPVVYAYPYGIYTDTSEKVLKENGYKVTLTTRSKMADIEKGLYKLKRYNMANDRPIEEVLK